jgi:hypothetical protein
MKINFLTAMFLLLLAAFASAELNQLTPGPGERAQQKPSNPTKQLDKLKIAQYGSEQFPVFVKIVHPKMPEEKLKIDSASENKKTLNKIYIDFSTIVLAFATVALAWYTFVLAKTTQIHERAYIFETQGSFIESGRFQSVMFNGGNTAAFIKKISITICDETELSTTPDYKNIEIYNQQVPPSKFDTSTWEKSVSDSNKTIVYGRIWYIDVFKKKHFSSFIFKLENMTTYPFNPSNSEYIKST